jgi:O-methyltransferase involved in polyketide biosynthesis
MPSWLDWARVGSVAARVLAEQGATPTAERREIAIDLREDWPQALRDSGFDASKPSAWIAEGLLIYLPAAAQQQLFTGIDALASSGSHVAVEDGAPMPAEAFTAALKAERAAQAEGDKRLFFQLVYNERHAPAEEWFAEHGWKPVATPLADYLKEAGRPVPGPDNEAGPMIARNTLVRRSRREDAMAYSPSVMTLIFIKVAARKFENLLVSSRRKPVLTAHYRL